MDNKISKEQHTKELYQALYEMFKRECMVCCYGKVGMKMPLPEKSLRLGKCPLKCKYCRYSIKRNDVELNLWTLLKEVKNEIDYEEEINDVNK